MVLYSDGQSDFLLGRKGEECMGPILIPQKKQIGIYPKINYLVCGYIGVFL